MLCPKCGEERNSRGLYLHTKFCKGDLLWRARYPKQAKILSPEAFATYCEKAGR